MTTTLPSTTHAAGLVRIGGYAGNLVTIECSRPGQAYTLFTSGHDLDVHLAGPSPSGGTGPIICGFDRFGRDSDGNRIGFAVGGGVTGPGYRHHACEECTALIGNRSVTGLHAALFPITPTTTDGDPS